MPAHWYFAGLNASNVLPPTTQGEPDYQDVRQFTTLPDLRSSPAAQVDVIFACFTQVVFRAGSRLIVRGFRPGVIDHDDAASIVSIIGDHSGFVGGLDRDGHLYLTDPASARAGPDQPPPRLMLVPGPLLAKVAIAGNFKVTIALKQSPGSSKIEILDFKDKGKFQRWYENPSDPANPPLRRHSIPGRIRQLISNTYIFILLTEDGALYTWGDARFRCHGRPIFQHPHLEVGNDAQEVVPHDRPGRVQSVNDENIVRISGGGLMFAGLTSEGHVYIWSGKAPTSTHCLSLHEGLQPSELAGVIIEDEEGEPRVFNDVAVGNGHVLLKTTDGRVYAAGENDNGQIGIGTEEEFYPDWVEVVKGGCTFIRVGSRMSMVRVTGLTRDGGLL